MLIKLLSTAIFTLIIFQAWTNIKEVQLVRDQKNAQLFSPIKNYLSNYINNIQGVNTRIKFSKLKTKTIIPGKNIIGEFDLSYNQEENKKDLSSRAYFKGTVELTSVDGNDWVASIRDIQNIRQDFTEPMHIQITQ